MRRPSAWGVSLSFLVFGIATKSTPIATQSINLGAKGTPEAPAFAQFKWRTPREAGHYCLQAQLHWHDDANPGNNLGQENVNVGILASPAGFSFELRNPASVRGTFALEADTYALPPAPVCDEGYQRRFGGVTFPNRLTESRAHWAWALRSLGYGTFSVPAREEDPIHWLRFPRRCRA